MCFYTRRLVTNAAALCCAALSLLAVSGTSLAQSPYLEIEEPERHALIIANWEYASLAPVNSAKKDLESVTALFRELDFDITVAPNVLDAEDLGEGQFNAFLKKVDRDDEIVVYYSGHGFSFQGFNYGSSILIPKTLDSNEILDWAFPIETMVNKINKRNAGHTLVIFDACRSAGDFKIIHPENEDGETETKAKGPSNPVRFTDRLSNTIIHFSSYYGLPAYEDGNSQTESEFTGVLLDFLADKSLRYTDINRRVYGQMEDDYGRQTAIHLGSRLAYYPGRPQEWIDRQTELWTAILEHPTKKKIEQYIKYNRLSPYVKSARQWLVDERRGRVTSTNAFSFTRYDANEIDKSWALAAVRDVPVTAIKGPDSVGVPRFASANTDRSIELDRLLSDVYSGAGSDLDLTKSASDIVNLRFSQADTLAIDELRPLFDRAFTETDPQGYVSGNQLVSLVDAQLRPGELWLAIDAEQVRTNTNSRFDRAYIPVAFEPEGAFDTLGKPIGEFSIPVGSSFDLFIDPSRLAAELNRIEYKNREVSWVSVTISAFVDPEPGLATDTSHEFEAFRNEALIAHIRYSLKALGIDATRVTYRTDDRELSPDSVRFRIIGH